MKKVLIILILTYSFSNSQSIDYFPAHVGDTWEWYSSMNDSTYLTEITKINVLSDSSSDIYYNNSVNPRYRISNDGKVYQHLGNDLILWYDFSLTPSDTLEVTIYSSPYLVISNSTMDNLFGSSIDVKTFTWVDQNNSYNTSQQWLSKIHGLYKTISSLGPLDDLVIGCIIDGFGFGTLVAVDDNINSQEFYLNQNYPNPFNPETTIEYSIPDFKFVSIKVYDLLGREIATLVNEEKPAGNHKVNFYSNDLSSGTYFYRLRAGKISETRKFVLMK